MMSATWNPPRRDLVIAERGGVRASTKLGDYGLCRASCDAGGIRKAAIHVADSTIRQFVARVKPSRRSNDGEIRRVGARRGRVLSNLQERSSTTEASGAYGAQRPHKRRRAERLCRKRKAPALCRVDAAEDLYGQTGWRADYLKAVGDFTGLVLRSNRSWTEFIHPTIQKTERRWRHSIATGEPFQLEHRFRRYDEVFRWHLTRAHAMRDAKGRIILWTGSNTDIDDLKQAAEERRQLLESERSARTEAERASAMSMCSVPIQL